MTGPTAAISVSVALPGASVLPSLLSVGTPASIPGAVPSLAAFVDLMIAQPALAPEVAPVEDRQRDAVPGKDLPDGKEDDTVDPALAWLLTTPVAPPLAPAVPVAPAGGPASAVTLDPDTPSATASAKLSPRVLRDDAMLAPQPSTVGVEPVPAPAPTSDADPILAAPTPTTPAASTAPAAPIAKIPTIDTPIAATPDLAPVRAPAVRTPAKPATQPANPIITAAMLRAPQSAPATIARALAATPPPALFALAMGRDGKDDDTQPATGVTAAALLLQPTDAATLIAKPGEAQRQALDMGQGDWPQKMIDRIETLRDNANATDTSIRLKPEALGRVDVSLKTHADGAVSVRFTAEQPATRSLIADAQPQLQAAAEARGIRLSQTSVDLANSGQSERQRPQFETQQNSSNRLAVSGEENEAVTDGRVA